MKSEKFWDNFLAYEDAILISGATTTQTQRVYSYSL